MSRRFIRRFAMVAALLAFTVAGGTVGFWLIDNYSPFEAFYMTLITITTVGYGEIRPLDQAGRIFNSFLIFFGVSAMFFAVGTMTQSIIELELQDRYGQRRRKRMIENMHDHVIVCGFGRVGRNASCELNRAKAPFLIIDRNEERVERAMQAGMLAVVADATRDDTLREAGVMRAKGLIAALPSDAENLFIILSAKTLNPGLMVVTRASEEEAEQKLRRAGADTVFAPYTMAGHRLAHAMIRPHVVEFVEFATGRVAPQIMLEQISVLPNAQFADKKFGELQATGTSGVIVLAIRRSNGAMVFNPSPEEKIAAGDFLIVLGEQEKLRNFEASVAPSGAKSR